MGSMSEEASSSGIVSKITQLFALYVIYVFLSGWTFFDYYFREFGVDPRWLDLPVQEILVKGFTVLLTHGFYLWPIYLAMIILPLTLDGAPKLQARLSLRLLVGSFLFFALFGVYFASRQAGTTEAAIDKGDKSRLPLITFSAKACSANGASPGRAAESPLSSNLSCDFTGRILTIRNATYYLQSVTPLNKQVRSKAIFVFRSDDLSDVTIAEH